MMKKITILLVFLFVAAIGNAQKKQNVYYLKNNGQEVSVKDSADFIRIVQEPDSGETNYFLQEFYANGQKKRIGQLSAFEPKLVLEGVVLGFNNKGVKTEAITYERGAKKGIAFYFFNNGIVKKQVEYLEDMPSPFSNLEGIVEDINNRLIYQVDSLGKVYVKDGTGHLIETSKIEGDELTEEGDYKNGFKVGMWKGNYSSGKSSFEEIYRSNKLVSGKNIVNGKIYKYDIMFQAPQFKGGVSKFYQYLSDTIRYPDIAREDNITGIVAISFVVQRDGSISEVLVEKSFHPALDSEAVHVMKASPNWLPGLFRGVPVKVKYTIPINFNLQE